MRIIRSLAIVFILIITLFGLSGCFFQQDASDVALEVAGGYEKETTKEEEVDVPELIAKHLPIPDGVKTAKLDNTDDDSKGDSKREEATLGIKPEPSTGAVLDKFKTSLEADGFDVKDVDSSTTNLDNGQTFETLVLDAKKEIDGGRVSVRIQGQIEYINKDAIADLIIIMLTVSHF